VRRSDLSVCWPKLSQLEKAEFAHHYFVTVGSDPVEWAETKLHFQPDPWQCELFWSTAKRIILNCNRQAGKSSSTAALALHGALHVPKSLTLLISPSQRQSSELFRKVTDFLESLPVKPRMDEDNKLSLQFENKSRIVSLPASEPTIRGYSAASLIVMDEASRIPDAIYGAVRPMLAVSGGRLILLSTPFGRRGFFFEAWENGGPDWQRISITADQCPRITTKFLAEERRDLGEWWFKQEYQGAFVETIDQLFTFESIQKALHDDVLPLFEEDPLNALWLKLGINQEESA
jgi:Terminase large subunit, T4likevirus-type, N-terminal